jgi:hypothetical protein
MNPFLHAWSRVVLSLLALSVAVSAIAPRAFAQANPNPPERLAYQGYLVDANGNPLGTNAPKNYDVIFRIWNDSSATAPANRLWTEQQTVTVDKGYFSVVLGEGSSIGETRPALSTIFTTSTASERWVSLTVKGIGTGGADANILPRLRLITSPYAFLATKATSVDGTALTSGTVPDARLSANVALRAGGNTFSGNQIINNNLGIGTATPNFPLSFPDGAGEKISLSGQGSGGTYGFGVQNNLFQIHSSVAASDIAFGYGSSANLTESMRIKGTGNVGIGTANPQAKLHVSGGSLQLDSGHQLQFADNGEIRSFDNNHRILFRRNENKLELREYGDIIFSPGANSGETAKAVLLAGGNMGIGTTNPAAKLHVAGVGNFLGSNPYIKFSDERTKGVAGGTANAGINTRVFNTTNVSQVAGSLVGTNAFSLPAGTYQCRISAPAYRVNQHQARLRIQNGNILLYGTSEFADSGTIVTTRSLIEGQFTLAASSNLQVEHFVTSGNSVNGFGAFANASWTDDGAKEVYSVAEFWRLQ